jgi:hypothetical protein
LAVQQEKNMPQTEVYQQIYEALAKDLSEQNSKVTLKRLAMMVSGTIKGQSLSPRQMAEAVEELEVTGAQAESIERRIRRSENAQGIDFSRSYAPFIQAILRRSQLSEVILVLDPTTQADHVVMVSINIWYRGRTIPLVWTIWPGNVPLEGKSFWERIEDLMAEAQRLLPADVSVTILADRAFGSPAFTDLAAALGWHWLVRVQNQTICRDQCGRERPIGHLVRAPGQRRKLAGQVFKKAGWRSASVVVYWGQHHKSSLCLVSDLPPRWELIHLYRRRFPIEGSFRDLKSYGWHWEQGQVRCLKHLERLLIVMALASCLILFLGTLFADKILARSIRGKRTTRPWFAKYSLFRLGLLFSKAWFRGRSHPDLAIVFRDWHQSNWSTQLQSLLVHAFIFA